VREAILNRRKWGRRFTIVVRAEGAKPKDGYVTVRQRVEGSPDPPRRLQVRRCFHGRITKSGNSTARHLVIEASQVLPRSGSPLTATYHRLRRKRGHNVAVTALARKLVVLVWHLLTNRQPYRYAASARTRTKLRAVTPNRRGTPAACAPQSLEVIYAEAGLPALGPAPPGQRRSAAANRRTLTRFKKAGATGRSAAHLTNS
jgi:hypothetical protein